MIIAISGLAGSGKSTIVKLLADRLSLPTYSVGALRGQMAIERGMTIEQLNVLGENEAFTDTEVDDYQTKLGASGASFIIDGRMSWHCIPQALKVLLMVDPDEGARRIFFAPKDDRADEQSYASIEELRAALAERNASDRRRYQKYYGVDFMDPNKYDVVVDTTHLTPSQVLEKILEKTPKS
ncbi:MAG: cytidylate kinase family protein [Patescibacteria group bacterium]